MVSERLGHAGEGLCPLVTYGFQFGFWAYPAEFEELGGVECAGGDDDFFASRDVALDAGCGAGVHRVGGVEVFAL